MLALIEDPAGSAETIWIVEPVLNDEVAEEERSDHPSRFEKIRARPLISTGDGQQIEPRLRVLRSRLGPGARKGR